MNGIETSAERFNDNGEIASVRESAKAAILNLQNNIERFDKSSYLENLNKLNQLTLSGLSEKIIVTEESVLKVLSDCLTIRNEDNEVISATIDCFANLISGQPDTISSDDLLKVQKFLSSEDKNIVENTLQVRKNLMKRMNYDIFIRSVFLRAA